MHQQMLQHALMLLPSTNNTRTQTLGQLEIFADGTHCHRAMAAAQAADNASSSYLRLVGRDDRHRGACA